jgi:hypothetical protein
MAKQQRDQESHSGVILIEIEQSIISGFLRGEAWMDSSLSGFKAADHMTQIAIQFFGCGYQEP